MTKNLIPLTILLLATFFGQAQTPESIFIGDGKLISSGTELACPDQFAGTISFSNFIGSSNDIDLDTIFFCFEDQIDIIHNGDMDLTGDPNILTEPGVTYAYFECPPGINGPNLTTVLTDGCILNNPMPAGDLWITAGGLPNGNQTFFNDGTSQVTFNSGDPVLIWFAPITIDDFSTDTYEADLITNEVGPCVNVNTDEAFAVVYLNEMVVTNENNMHGGALCKGSFRIQGGLPEFDSDAFYDIEITSITDPTAQVNITSGPASDLETVIFDVPKAGVYNIQIEDGKSCGLSFTMNFAGCQSISASLPDLTVAPMTNICVDVTNESNFINIISTQFSINWDQTVLEFDQITNLNPNMPGLNVNTSFGPPTITDALIFIWFDPNSTGISLPNDAVFFSICFNVIGSDGDCSDLSFSSDPSPIEVYNNFDVQIGFDGINGGVCVSSDVLAVTFEQDSVECAGQNNGSFTATVSGGQAPYELFWSPLAGGSPSGPGTINLDGGSFTANNLFAGSYLVTITDDLGTTTVDTAHVFEPELLSVNINEFEPPCFGDMGSLQAILVLGQTIITDPTPYTIQWSNGDNLVTTQPIPSGLYSVTVTAPDGCSATGSSLLPEPPELAPMITFDTATCPGITDGAIFVQVFGGTPDMNGDYTIEWPTIGPGLVFQNDMSTVSGLEQDCYPLIITDSNNCTFQETICIPVHKEIMMTPVTVQDVLCAGTCTGEIEIVGSTSGAAADLPYNFIWQGVPPPPPAVDDQTSTHITGMDAGVYSVTMQDAAGCEIDTMFTLEEPPPLELDTISVMQASCSPGMDGEITVLATGGTGNITYDWNTIPASMGATVSNLDSGDYMVTATDMNGCTDTASFVIINPTPPVITQLLDDNLLCANSTDGSLTVVATPGGSPIEDYLWTPSNSGMTINNLGVGQYIVTVVDENGCFDIDTAMVIAPEPMTLDSFVLEMPDCPGDGGGSVAAFVSGGQGPYYFEWSAGFSGVGVAVIGGNSISAGCYQVTVIDANNCDTLFAEACIDDPPSILVGFSNIQDVSCPVNTMELACDGGATATAFYSNGDSGLFDFMWNPSGEQDNDVTASTANQLCVGVNTLTVADGMCFIDTMITIGAPPDLSVEFTLNDVSCNGGDDGSATAMPSGGTGPYTITWETITGPFISGLIAGNHDVTITDFNNCSVNHTIQLQEPEVLTIQINDNNTNDVTCPDGMDGRIGVFAEGGNIVLGGETYVWENGIAPNGADIAEGLASGTYSVTVIDALGCEADLTYSISEPPPINFTVDLLSGIGCFNEAATLTVPTVTGGNTTTYQFFIDQGIPRLIGEPAPVFAGDHTVTVIDVINGCTVDTVINIFEPLPIGIELPSIIEIELGDSLTQLNPKIISSLPIDTFLWTPPNQLSCADCKDPRVIAVNDQLYTLTIVDVNGCTATAQVFVEIDRNRNVYIPNIFSPNDDGINDKFKIYTGLGVENIRTFRIFDRWGEIMYEEFNLPPNRDGVGEWDGRFNGDKMKPAVFVYIVEVEFLDGSTLVYRGDVTLIR